MSSRSTVIGIDLGTTYSVVAHVDEHGLPRTLTNAEGDVTTPSAVFFDRQGVIVGKEALRAAAFEPDRVALFAKRDVGEAKYSRKILGCQVPAEVIEALVLKKLKQDAERTLGPVRQAVITVPAFFTEPCRKATQDAGLLAGLEVLDIINEPTAAALCYGVEQGFLNAGGTSKQPETLLVYDLGGGTFDVTIMRLEGDQSIALATRGDVYLGGLDWDERIVARVASQFESEHGIDPRSSETARQELLTIAQEAKHALSARSETQIFFRHEGQGVRLNFTRDEFEELTSALVERTKLTVINALQDAGLQWSDLTRVLTVGGSTRMPMITSMLESLSGVPIDQSLSPDEAVAKGAAIYAGMLSAASTEAKPGFSIRNVCSHDLGVLGVEVGTNRKRRQIMIARNSPLPAQTKRVFPTARDGQRGVSVEIIEGGTDTGDGATRIGQCVVYDLPEGLPKGTRVEVGFAYQSNGRLDVSASLPSIGKNASLELDRKFGLSSKQLDKWRRIIADGLTDDSLARLSSEHDSREVEEPQRTEMTSAPTAVAEESSPPRTASVPPGVKPKRLTEAHLIAKLTPVIDATADVNTAPTNVTSDWKSRRKKIQPR